MIKALFRLAEKLNPLFYTNRCLSKEMQSFLSKFLNKGYSMQPVVPNPSLTELQNIFVVAGFAGFMIFVVLLLLWVVWNWGIEIAKG